MRGICSGRDGKCAGNGKVGTTLQRTTRATRCSATGGNDRLPRQCLQSGPRNVRSLTGAVVLFNHVWLATPHNMSHRLETALTQARTFDTVRWHVPEPRSTRLKGS